MWLEPQKFFSSQFCRVASPKSKSDRSVSSKGYLPDLEMAAPSLHPHVGVWGWGGKGRRMRKKKRETEGPLLIMSPG